MIMNDSMMIYSSCIHGCSLAAHCSSTPSPRRNGPLWLPSVQLHQGLEGGGVFSFKLSSGAKMLSTSFAGHHLLSLVPATTNSPRNQSGTHKHEGLGNGIFFEINHVKHGSINYNKPTQSSCILMIY